MAHADADAARHAADAKTKAPPRSWYAHPQRSIPTTDPAPNAVASRPCAVPSAFAGALSCAQATAESHISPNDSAWKGCRESRTAGARRDARRTQRSDAPASAAARSEA